MAKLPDLSRFELQCLRKLWDRGQATIREIHGDLDDPPGYTTVKKIVERLEEKGAVVRVRKEGRAWVYRSPVSASAMIRKEIHRFLDTLFDGAGTPLVAHLAEMKEVSLDDLREIERQLGRTFGPGRRTRPDRNRKPARERKPD
ncbi:MAG: BlaI/MecI/CopY family transcriptional regulator [bacterium]|jgi:predicted transcriptional regulator